MGEGEETLQELLIRMSGETRTPFESIRGLAFGSASGKIVRTQPRPVIRDLESLPGAAWDLVDLDMYRRDADTPPHPVVVGQIPRLDRREGPRAHAGREHAVEHARLEGG